MHIYSFIINKVMQLGWPMTTLIVGPSCDQARTLIKKLAA